MSKINIKEFDNTKHRQEVITLWREVFGYEDARNAPELVIDKKIEVDDGLFFVAVKDNAVVGTIMAGYDGHRGWIYSLAVLPKYRRKGIASALLEFAEEKLSKLGCVKINLQIMGENKEAHTFYQANEYRTENRISMGKQLKENIKNI